LNRKEKFWRL